MSHIIAVGKFLGFLTIQHASYISVVSRHVSVTNIGTEHIAPVGEITERHLFLFTRAFRHPSSAVEQRWCETSWRGGLDGDEVVAQQIVPKYYDWFSGEVCFEGQTDRRIRAGQRELGLAGLSRQDGQEGARRAPKTRSSSRRRSLPGQSDYTIPST